MPNTTAPNIGYGPRYTVKTFNGDANDYDCWEDGFLGTLRLLGLHFAMDKYSSTRPATFNVAEAKQTIYDYLSNCLDRTSHGLIKREAPGDGVAALTALRNYYLRETEHRTFTLWRNLVNVKMGDKNITEYLTSIDETVAQLKEAGKQIDNGLIVISTLDGLPEAYSTFVAIANQRTPIYTYEQLKIALLTEEERLNKDGGVDNVLAVNKNIYCHKCGISGSLYPS